MYICEVGADKRTRTSTGLLPLEPESSASTNSAMSALYHWISVIVFERNGAADETRTRDPLRDRQVF